MSTESTTQRIEISPKTILAVIVAAFGSWLAIQLLPVLVVVVVALFMVGTLNPAVRWLERHRMRRTRAIALVFVSVFALTAGLLTIIVPSLIDEARTLLQHIPEVRKHVVNFLASHTFTQRAAEALRTGGPQDEAIRLAASKALSASARVFEGFAYLLTAVFLALYIMLDRERLRGGLFALLPRHTHLRLSRVILRLETIVGGYIRGHVLTSSFVAIFTLILLAILRVPDALALAVFAAIMDVLPYVGVALAMPAIAAAASAHGLTPMIVVCVLMIAYQEFENRVLLPHIYGKALNLPSAVVLVALLAGGVLGGVIGALLSLPIAAGIRMLLEELRVSLPGGSLADETNRELHDQAELEYAARAEGLSVSEAAALATEISQASSEAPQPSEPALHGR